MLLLTTWHCYAGTFVECPRVRVDTASEAADFWAAYSANPRPHLLVSAGINKVDFVRQQLDAHTDGSISFFNGDLGSVRVGGKHNRPYMLTNRGYTPEIFDGLPERHPLPEVVRAVDLRLVLSIGQNGTGETDIAHHYHPMTAMRLLQGRKIWALRPPGDADCESNSGDCTDPFSVCDYYARPDSPRPACVQEAGDTILVPDGWYHGTCNNASWTVGWGGQGRRLEHTPPRCYHCRRAGQMRFAFTHEDVITRHDAAAITAEIRKPGMQWLQNFLHIRFVSQAPYQAFRSLFHQFVLQTDREAEANAGLRSPDCKFVRLSMIAQGQLADMTTVGDVHMLVHVHGPPPTLLLRHLASGETEERAVQPRRAVFWVDNALAAIRPSADATQEDVAVACRAERPDRQPS